MNYYFNDGALDLFSKIREQFDGGNLVIDSTKDKNVDHIVGLIENDFNTNNECREIINHYRDLDGNLAFKVTRHHFRSEINNTLVIVEYQNRFFD